MREFLLKPICDLSPGDDGARLAGGPISFRRMATLSLDRATRLLPLKSVAPDALSPFVAPRDPVLGVTLDRPRIMGVLNVTPDSFSDGGAIDPNAAVDRALAMIEAGADFIDIGGESTRPGATPVTPAQEVDRVLPVIEMLAADPRSVPISIDTRNAVTAKAALKAGAALFNDVSALTHDANSLAIAAETGCAICLMHARGDPETMQANATYRNALIEVYAWLESRLAATDAAGVPRSRIVVDPGIGFGKTMAHNVELISGLAAFQGLGCAVMLGASRKRFVGALAGVDDPGARGAASVGAAIAGAAQGAQILRVHDVGATRQALDVWMACSGLWPHDARGGD